MVPAEVVRPSAAAAPALIGPSLTGLALDGLALDGPTLDLATFAWPYAPVTLLREAVKALFARAAASRRALSSVKHRVPIRAQTLLHPAAYADGDRQATHRVAHASASAPSRPLGLPPLPPTHSAGGAGSGHDGGGGTFSSVAAPRLIAAGLSPLILLRPPTTPVHTDATSHLRIERPG